MIHGRLGGELEADARWERALLWWGAGRASAVLGVAVLCGLPSGFDPDTLGGRSRSSAIAEAVLVLATLRRLAAQRLIRLARADAIL